MSASNATAIGQPRLGHELTFSDEQGMLLDTAADFFRRTSPSARVRELLTSSSGYAPEVWQEMVDLGWLGLAVPEEFGGSELGLGAAVCIAEPMGRFLSATPFLSTQLFVQGLLAAPASFGAEHLSATAAGQVATVALFEAQGSWHLDKPSATANLGGGKAKLSGSKALVLDAQAAERLLVLVECSGVPVLALVHADQLPANCLQRETVIDETRRSYRLNLTGVEIPESQLLSSKASALALANIEQAAWLLLGAEAAGGIAGVLDLLVEYLNTRQAFGRKIGSYQGLKHPTVDILVGLERTRSHLYHAATLLDGGQEAQIALRMAKAQASDSYTFAGDRAIQFHGGFGFTYDCDAQLFLRRALWSQATFGDAPHHRKRLAQLLF